MGINDIPEITSRVELKKESDRLDKTSKKKEEAIKGSEAPANTEDSVEITDAKIAIEKENILASKTTIENFDHAKSLLANVLDDVDEENLLQIHGNADKIKTFLIM
jgi:hypothetical protein